MEPTDRADAVLGVEPGIDEARVTHEAGVSGRRLVGLAAPLLDYGAKQVGKVSDHLARLLGRLRGRL